MGGRSSSRTYYEETNNVLTGEGNIAGDGNTVVNHNSDADVLKHISSGAFDTLDGFADSVTGIHDTNAGLLDSLGGSLLQLTADATRDSNRLAAGVAEREQLGAAAGQADALKWVALAAVLMVGAVMLGGRKK